MDGIGLLACDCGCSPLCTLLINCDTEATITTASDLSAYSVGDVLKRDAGEGGGCWEIIAFGAACVSPETFTVAESYAACIGLRFPGYEPTDPPVLFRRANGTVAAVSTAWGFTSVGTAVFDPVLNEWTCTINDYGPANNVTGTTRLYLVADSYVMAEVTIGGHTETFPAEHLGADQVRVFNIDETLFPALGAEEGDILDLWWGLPECESPCTACLSS